MITIVFPDGKEWNCPINIGDLLEVTVKDMDFKRADHVCEIDIKWDSKLQEARISGIYGHQDNGFEGFKEIEVIKKSEKPLDLYIKHEEWWDYDRYALSRDGKDVHLLKIEHPGVYIRDNGPNYFTRYYETEKGWDLELDDPSGNDGTNDFIILPRNASDLVRKWVEKVDTNSKLK